MDKTKKQSLFVELHVLVSHVPSNLNRDDLGTPKTAMFGGYRRLRISSQCLKRTWRLSDAFHDALPADELGTRTKRLPKLVDDELKRRNLALSEDEGRGLQALFSALGKKKADASLGDVEGEPGTKAAGETAHLLFLLPEEITAIVDFVALDATRKRLATCVKAEKKAPRKGLAKKGSKQEAQPAGGQDEGEVKQEWKSDDAVVEKLRDGLQDALAAVRGAVDVAMFGRFLTSDEFRTIEAATQVAHAIGTQKAEVEVDYFTAVDDLSGEAAAGHLGETEYGSAVFYKYAACDTPLLLRNLSRGVALAAESGAGDAAAAEERKRAARLAVMALPALVGAAARAVPTGKKNGTAPQNVADYVEVVVRRDAPVSLANAFLMPVTPTEDKDVMDRSIEALRRQADQYDKGYGEEGVVARFAFSPRGDGLLAGFGESGKKKRWFGSLAELGGALKATLEQELSAS